MQSFTAYQLAPYLMSALDELQFVAPTPIQQAVIPLVLRGDSVVAQAQTGSGKSHSFLLPLLHRIDPQLSQVQVVITVPSRELANQLYEVCQQLVRHAEDRMTVARYVGGTDKQRQATKLQQSQPHVVIGTPGRLLDLMKDGALNVRTATSFVVDEADMTLDLGFLNDVDEIATQMPKDLQMLVFSATIPQKLQPFLKKYLANPTVVDLAPQTVVADTITNYLLATKGHDVIDLLVDVLAVGQPYLAMIFANTKVKADQAALALREKGLKVAVLHGDVPARERKRLLKQIQQLDYQYVVATDLAARGIDISGVSHVINLEIPKELDFFIHRVGRTGRNQLPGTAITFYYPGDDDAVALLEKRGIHFQAVTLKNGELVETFDRNRRKKREKQVELSQDTRVKGMVKKAKQQVKPGYKRKLKEQIAQHERKVKRNQRSK